LNDGCDSGLEAGFRFFVARGEAAELFEPGKGALDAIAVLVQVLIVLARHLAIALGRNDSLCLRCFDVLQNGIGIAISSVILPSTKGTFPGPTPI
jgi:hypothetical protein